jgi:hypothetical protein
MTIDERIEALTQSVDLLAQMHQDSEREYKELFRQNREHILHVQELVGHVVELQEAMTRVVTDHDGRIRRLEGQ